MGSLERETILRLAFRYRDALEAYAYGLVGEWSAAEDMVQEAFLVVAEKWEEIEAEAALFAYLRETVRRKCLEFNRRRGRLRTMEEEHLMNLVEMALRENIEPDLHRARLWRAIEGCMKKIKEKALNFLRSFYLEGKSYNEIAQTYDCGIEDVRKTLLRGREALRNCAERSLRREDHL